MNKIDSDKAWEILIERKERGENRCAFIAGLIVQKSASASGDYYNGFEVKTIAPHLAEAFAIELTRLAIRIKREAEAACSFERNAAQEATDEANQARFAAIAGALGFEARTGGDPRGACAYLIDPDDPKGGDGWGTGWAVY